VKKIVLIPLVIVLAIGLVFGACAEPAPSPAPAPAPTPAPAPSPTPSPAPSPSPTPTPAPTPSPPAKEIPKEIRVGTVSSLTGMFAGFGTGGSWGLSAAVDDVNRIGGVYVKEYDAQIPIRHILLNSESDPIKGGTLTENLILGEKINFLVSNPEPITVHIEKNNLADRYKIPHVGGVGPFEPYCAVREEVETHWEYTWCCSFGIATPPPEGDPRHGNPGYTILETWKTWLDLFGDQTNKTIGVYASDDPDGIGWFGLFGEAIGEWGYNVVGYEDKLGLFPMGTTDFRPLIQEWKDNEVEIIWGNCPAPDFGTMWRQARSMDFKPKMVGAARAALFYTEVAAWGGDLPLGCFIEMWWHPSFDPEQCPGIGGTTPQSLAERWTEDTGLPINISTGWAYPGIQVLADAIERAGTLDGDAVNAAIAETNLQTIDHLIKYDPVTHHTWSPLFIGQWYKTDTPEGWELPVVFSTHDFINTWAEPIFPIPYD
jgi:branched-chain amino acid transport system substrate-binding protein